uniref:Uncharacterized protein n=1 Tax=Eptatretus burgeri TaxID=7764 RepID=A0A8C4R6V6_EPTBU
MAAFGQLFSLELLVDSVRLNRVTQTCRSPALILRFMDFPAMIFNITSSACVPQALKRDVRASWVFNSGKSCLFSFDPTALGARLGTSPVRVMLIDCYPESSRLLASTSVTLTGALAVFEMNVDQKSSAEPWGHGERGTYSLRNPMGETIGSLTIGYRLFNLGRWSTTRSSSALKVEKNPMSNTVLLGNGKQIEQTLDKAESEASKRDDCRAMAAPPVDAIPAATKTIADHETEGPCSVQHLMHSCSVSSIKQECGFDAAQDYDVGNVIYPPPLYYNSNADDQLSDINHKHATNKCTSDDLTQRHEREIELKGKDRLFEVETQAITPNKSEAKQKRKNTQGSSACPLCDCSADPSRNSPVLNALICELSRLNCQAGHRRTSRNSDLKCRLDLRHRESCAENHMLENSQSIKLRHHLVDEQQQCAKGSTRQLHSSSLLKEHLNQRQLLRRRKLKQDLTGSRSGEKHFARRKEPLNYGLTHTFRLRLQHTTNALAQRSTQNTGHCNVERKRSKRTQQRNGLEGNAIIQKSTSNEISFADKGVQVVIEDMCVERPGGKLKAVHDGMHLPGDLMCQTGIDKSVQTIPGPWLKISRNFQESELKDQLSVLEKPMHLTRRRSELSVKDESVHSKYSPSAAQSESNIPSLKQVEIAGKCTLDETSSEEEEHEYSDDFSGSFESLSDIAGRTSCASESSNKTLLSASPSAQPFSDVYESDSDFIFHTDPQTKETRSESDSERTSRISEGNSKSLSQEPEGNLWTHLAVSSPIASCLQLNEIGFDGTSAAKSYSLDGCWYEPIQQTALNGFQPQTRLPNMSAIQEVCNSPSKSVWRNAKVMLSPTLAPIDLFQCL